MLRYHKSNWINLVKWRGNESMVWKSRTVGKLPSWWHLPIVLPPKSSWVDTCASQEMNSIRIHLKQLHVGKTCASSWLHPFPLAASSWYSGQRPFHRSFGKWDVEESWRFNSYDWLRSGMFLHVTVASSLLPFVTEPLSSQFPNLCLSEPAVISKIAAAFIIHSNVQQLHFI